jgi:hypothetical protein
VARDAEIERRLLNWARWKRGGQSGGLGFGAPSASAMAGMRGGGTYREAVIPVWDAEASVTDQAVQSLPADLVSTVDAYYLGQSNELGVAQQLGIAVRSLHARIERAHGLVGRWLEERRMRLDAERKRVEALQRAR